MIAIIILLLATATFALCGVCCKEHVEEDGKDKVVYGEIRYPKI